VPVQLTLQPEIRGPLSVYPVAALRPFGVDAFVTDRFGGVSDAPYDTLNLGIHVGDDAGHVNENRRRVALAAGVDTDHLVIARQVHGNNIIDAAVSRDAPEADGIVTSSSELALAILVADCVPILLVDAMSSNFAVVHAGWRGLEARVIDRAVSRFSNVSTLHAFIGPSISFEGYQVGPEVASHFEHVPGAVAPDTGDRFHLDLRRVGVAQLRELGLHDEHIITSVQCTDGGGLFFSDRAQRPCGRFALVAKRVVT
jgi:hypothetical protein